MNINEDVIEYINKMPEDEPILSENIKEYVLDKNNKEEKVNISKNVNVILNRLKNEGIVKNAYKGVYYKPTKSIFGDVPLDIDKLIKLKYIEDKGDNIKGYLTGAKLFNRLGLTTLVPNVTEIVTNECKYHKEYDTNLRVYITKPKIKITNENYKYLQFIDVLENKDNIHIEAQNVDDILYEIIEQSNLDFETLLKYIRETKSKNVLNKILALAR